MKKTIQINIAGVNFNIEEDAYPVLSQYLESIKKYFAGYEGSEEIISDIEARIAEKFNKKNDIIEKSDVDQIIKSMGTVSDFEAVQEEEDLPKNTENQKSYANNASTNNNMGSQFFKDTKHKALGGVLAGLAHKYEFDVVWARILFIVLSLGLIDHGIGGILIVAYVICWIAFPAVDNLTERHNIKKFYRLPENKVLGGVATGLSSYLGIDLVIVRIIFVVLGFAGVGIITYIIFWIVAPNAFTITQKMELKGQPVTIENIETSIKSNNLSSNQTESPLAKLLLFPFRIIGIVIKALGGIIGPLGSVVKIFAGLILFLIGSALSIASLAATGAFFGIFGDAQNWVQPHQFFNMFSQDFPLIGGFFAFLVTFIPAISIIILGISLMTNQKHGNRNFWLTTLALWFAGLVGISAVGSKYALNFSKDYEYTETVPFNTPSKILYLDIEKTSDEDNESIFNTSIKLETATDSKLTLIKNFSAKGRTQSVAENNAKDIKYDVTQADSVLVFGSKFKLNAKSAFRNQRLNNVLAIPKGTKFKMSRKFADYLLENHWELLDNFGIENENIEKFTFEMGQNNEVICGECPKLSEQEKEAIQSRKFDDNDEIDNDDFENKGTFTKKLTVSNFEKVDLGQNFIVEIRKGNTQQVEIFSENQKTLDQLKIKVEDNELKITYDDPFVSHSDKVNVVITMPKVSSINLSGAAVAKVLGFENTDRMDVDLSGNSKMALDIKCNVLNVQESGASTLICNGSANQLKIDLTGASNIKAKNLATKKATIEASGSSIAEMGKVEDLQSDLSGGSEVIRE